MIDLQQILKKKIEKLDKQIKQAATERDESATPAESQHDQTRQIANQLYNSLLEEKRKYLEIAGKISKEVESFELNGKKYVIVPEGLGGETIDGVTLISENAPLAKKYLKK